MKTIARGDRAPWGAVAARVVRGLRCGFLSMGAYEILAKLFVVGLLGPMSGALVMVWIQRMGSPAVSNAGIVSFLLSPAGAAAVFTTAALALFVAFFETAGMLVIADSSLEEQLCRAAAALGRVCAMTPRLLAMSVFQLAAFTAAATPFVLALAACYRLFLGGHDINYYLATKPAEFWWAVLLGGACLLGLALAWAVIHLRLLFALPACAISGQPARVAVQWSWHCTRRRFRQLAVAMGVWAAATAGLTLLAGLLLAGIGQAMIAAGGDHFRLLVVLLACILVLDATAAAIVSFVGAATYSMLVATLYREAVGDPATADETRQRPPGPALPAWLTRRRAVWGLTAAFFVATGTATYGIVTKIPTQAAPAVTAHRGSSLVAPENTLSAVKAAIRQGADFAEIDVQQTVDGQVVVIHDTDLMRIAGSPKKISQATYEEIARCDAGGWFSPEFRGERVPTLQQVLDAAKGSIRLNIELKFDGDTRSLAAAVVDLLRKNDVRSQCVLTSLDYDGIQEVKRLDKGVQVGHIVSLAIGDVSGLEVDFLSLHHEWATPEVVHSLHRAGKRVHVWTVNDRSTLLRMISSGVDNVISDDPELALAACREWEELDEVSQLILSSRSWLGR